MYIRFQWKLTMARPSSKEEHIKQLRIAALENGLEKGFQNLTMASVAKEAGISVGTIYLYYKNKDELFASLFDYVQKACDQHVLESLDTKIGVKDKFFYLCESLCLFYLKHPLEFTFIEQYSNSSLSKGLFGAFSKDLEKQFQLLYKESLSEGVVQKLPLVTITSLVHGSIVALVKKHHLGHTKVTKKMRDQLISLMWKAIAA